LKRLEAVACDAELQEKPLNDLRKLGELLRERCVQALSGNQENNDENSQSKQKGRVSLKLGNVAVNARTVMACETEMEPLDHALPADPAERAKWLIDFKYVYLTSDTFTITLFMWSHFPPLFFHPGSTFRSIITLMPTPKLDLPKLG